MFLVTLKPVQNFIARRAVTILADKLKTRVALQNIKIDFLNHILIEGLYIESHQHDTLLYAGQARVRITDWFFLKKGKPELTYLGLHDAYVHLYRTAKSEEWNYQFIADAFSSGPKKTKTTKKSNDFEVDLKKIDIQRTRFHMDDAWTGNDMDFDVGSLQVKGRNTDLVKHIIDIDDLSLENVAIAMRDYDGGRPPRPKKPKNNTVDTTAFNTDNWKIKATSVSLENCAFSNDIGKDKPTAGEFDPEHIGVSKINMSVKDLAINKDTLTARLKNFSAAERCGLLVKKLQADVMVSPNASICDNLYLETNNSILKSYYAMRYQRFPDFNDYINKVVMEGHFDNASVDSKDVAFFAPVLKQYPAILKISGNVAGTVDSISGTKLAISDGANIVKGDLAMRGLPDINRTFINYENGEFYTSSNGILRYAPSLRNNPNINIESINHAYFKGNFRGYIENFAFNGTLATNLGVITSDIKMKLPQHKGSNAAYSGTVSTNNLNIGAFLRQSDLGTVSMKANVTGNSFDPLNASAKIDASIGHITYRGYAYQNITAEGVLAKNKFTGKLLVDDPNLALAFNGDADFSNKEVKLNATANLLKSDFAALKLSKDSITLSADFDLNCIGTNIDNFSGYAKLYNINLVRNKHRMDLDSIYVNSSQENGNKYIVVESNALAAKISGQYELSSLPYSFQYYLAGYLPNYIHKPTRYAADQNLRFEITTREIDSLLAVAVPGIKGFSNSTINGTLNTTQQSLNLDVNVPYGRVSNVTFRNVAAKGTGNFNSLTLNANAGNVYVGDSAITGSMSLSTTIGNDSLSFSISTTSPDAFGTANISGGASARGDTLRFSLLPSDFYLNNDKWNINGGRAVYTSNYLWVNGLSIQSGLQQINVNSQNNTQTILVDIKELDVAQLGNLAGISSYQPEGRINGSIKVDNILQKMFVTANIKATGVKLMTDTLGDINVAGTYDAAKNILNLDNTSGIYRGNSSITASGKLILFDSISGQKLDGNIQFNNTPLSWTSALLQGYISRISGTLNGTVNIGGTAAKPDVDGSVKLSDAGLRIDMLGPYYTIPTATITVNNKEINLGSIELIDAYKNTAILQGKIMHDRFSKMRISANLHTNKFEVINLKEYESNLFYGNLVAGMQNLTVNGYLDDITLRITKAVPEEKSHLFLPIGTTSAGENTYSYVTFKNYGTAQQAVTRKRNKNKFTISIDALLNPLAEITMVLDPSTGDAINATGTGSINITIPAGNDIRMTGTYEIEEGDYTFTLKQLFFKRKFDLNKGSRIAFRGPIAQTDMDIEGVYRTTARLYDILNKDEKIAISNDQRELSETRAPQDVDLLLYMRGSLTAPKLTFKLDLPSRRGIGTYAYQKLSVINQNEKDLFNEVASLLLINSLTPLDQGLGEGGSGTATGAISNVSEILSSTASAQVTNIVNKITGDKNLAIDLRYKTYSYDATAQNSTNRNELSFGVRKNLFNDRLALQVGSSYDWGRSSASSSGTTNNLAGDFRLEYLLKEGGNLRLSIFRTSSYDAIVDNNVSRGGAALSWRKSFNSFAEFFRGENYAKRQEPEDTLPADTSTDRRNGTE